LFVISFLRAVTSGFAVVSERLHHPRLAVKISS